MDAKYICSVLRDELNDCECHAGYVGECSCDAVWPEQVATEAADLIESLRSELAAKDAEIERLRADRDRHRGELENIANANPMTWESPSEFAVWARSRARHSLSGGAARRKAAEAAKEADRG